MMKMLLTCFSASLGSIKHALPKDNTSEMAGEVLNSKKKNLQVYNPQNL